MTPRGRPYKQAMFGGDFVFNTSRAEAAEVSTPTLLLMGNDLYHPESISRDLASLLRNVAFVETWKHDVDATDHLIQAFLSGQTP